MCFLRGVNIVKTLTDCQCVSKFWLFVLDPCLALAHLQHCKYASLLSLSSFCLMRVDEKLWGARVDSSESVCERLRFLPHSSKHTLLVDRMQRCKKTQPWGDEGWTGLRTEINWVGFFVFPLCFVSYRHKHHHQPVAGSVMIYGRCRRPCCCVNTLRPHRDR